jgi:hypothetical protein
MVQKQPLANERRIMVPWRRYDEVTPMKREFQGEICVYCGKNPAETDDHLVARKFFLVERRNNLPKAPSCWSCNNRKSQCERYLMTVLPFGAKHPDARANLQEFVPRRLEKDAKLRRKLERGFAKSGGAWIPYDHKPLDELFEMVARGLAWQHFGLRLGDGYSVIASTFSNDGETLFEHVISSSSKRVSGDLGNHTFMYEGAQAERCPELTVWRFWIYGGIDFGGDPDVPGLHSLIVAMTGPSTMIQDLRYTSFRKERSAPNVGRNDPCPCRSGKKYKKCHGSPTRNNVTGLVALPVYQPITF